MPHGPAGFDGRGGKYAKLNLQYEMKGGGPKLSHGSIGRDDGVPVIQPDESESTWSSSDSPSIYIPLRASAKKH